jgi:hypothetical protein
MLVPDSTGALQRGSPLIDAGNPDVQDLDGTRSDIGWLGGPGGATYPYLELPPATPDIVSVIGNGSFQIFWKRNSEADLAGYRVYRSTQSGFTPSESNLWASLPVADSTLLDSAGGGTPPFYYRLTSVDSAGLESEPTDEVTWLVSGIFDSGEPGSPIPQSPAIVRTYPNPFNSSVLVEYSLPDVGAQPASVSVRIYNVLGQLVRIVTEGNGFPGLHQVAWDARDQNGLAVPSGVYFVHLLYWGRPTEARKVVLVK